MKRSKHGLYYHPLYRVWAGMKHRCGNEDADYYKDYGGRGISVCDEWIENPKSFIKWALSHGWEKGLEIDRENNDGNYTPNNCRFVDRTTNNNNCRLLQRNNSTGYRGVQKVGGKYMTQLKVNGKNKYLGYFDSPVIAALRYDAEVFMLNDGRPMNFIGRD